MRWQDASHHSEFPIFVQELDKTACEDMELALDVVPHGSRDAIRCDLQTLKSIIQLSQNKLYVTLKTGACRTKPLAGRWQELGVTLE